jgi:Flp pilus assembly protein TadB
VADSLPEVVDLVLLGVAAGLSVPAALHRTVELLPVPYRDVLGDAIGRAERGEPFAVALDRAAVVLGPAAQPLVTALATAGRDGGPVTPALQRVADDARHRRRVTAQARARRLPVTMLLPLVVCVLPAFVLVSIVPLVAASVRDLRLGG